MPKRKSKLINSTVEEIKKLTDDYIIPAIKSEINRVECRLKNIEILLGIPEEQLYCMKSREERIRLFEERLKALLK